MMYLNEDSENGFGTINESKTKKMTNWTNIFNHWKRKGKSTKNGVITSTNGNLTMSQPPHPHLLHHHHQQHPQHVHHQVYPIHPPYQFGSLAVRQNGSGLPGLIEQYNTSNGGGGVGGGASEGRYQRSSGLHGRASKFASVSAGTANFYLAYPTGPSLLATNQPSSSSSPCSLNIRYPSSAPPPLTTTTAATLHSSIRPTSSSRHQRTNILSTPWEPMTTTTNSSANHNQAAACTCCESMGTGHHQTVIGGVSGATTLTNFKKSTSGSVRSRSSIKSSSYCASNFDIVDETTTGLQSSHVTSRHHHGTVGAKSIKSSTRSHRTVSFATVNERFLKVLRKSVKNPSGSVVSRRSILECDLTAYDLIEQSLHETCIEDEDVIIEEEKENQHHNHKHYANNSIECLSEDEDEDMDNYLSHHHQCQPSISASTNGLNSISKHGRNLLPRLGESSLRGKSRGKSISTVDLSSAQRQVITDGKASLRKGLRIGGQGMSLFPSAVDTTITPATSSAVSTITGVIKSRSSESILSDKSTSIVSSNLVDRPASCLLLPLPEPDYDSEAASGEDDGKHHAVDGKIRNQINLKNGSKLRDAQSFTSLHQPQLGGSSLAIRGSDIVTPLARQPYGNHLGETRSLDRRAKRRAQLKQSMSSSSLIGNSLEDNSVNLRQIKGSTPSIPNETNNYMSKVKSILKKSVTWNESVTKAPVRSSLPTTSTGNANCDNFNGSTINSDSDLTNYKCSSIIANGLTTLPRVRGHWSSERSSTNSANRVIGGKGGKAKKHVHFGCSKDDDSLIIEHIGDNTIFEEDEEPIYDDIANIITTNDQSPSIGHSEQPLTSRLSQIASPPPPPPPPPPPTSSVPTSTTSSTLSLAPTQSTPNLDNTQLDDNKVNCDNLNINQSSSSLKTSSFGTNDDETKEMSTRRVYGILEIGDSLNSPRSTSSYLQLAPKSSDQLTSDSSTNGRKTIGSKVIKEQPALSSSSSSPSSNQLYKISRSEIINGLRRDVDLSSSQSSSLSSSSDENDLLSNGKQLNGNDSNQFDGNNQVNHNRLMNNDGPLSPEFTSSLTNHHNHHHQQQQLTNIDNYGDERRHSTLLSELRADIKEKLENKLIKDIIISNELKSLAEKSIDCNRFNGLGGGKSSWSSNNNQRSKSNLINSITNVNNTINNINNNRIVENHYHSDSSNQRNQQSTDCNDKTNQEQNNFDSIDEDGETINLNGKTDYGFTISIVNNVNNNSNRNRNCDYSLTSPYSSNTSSSSYYDTNLPLEESSKIVINVPMGGVSGYDPEPNDHIYEELDKVSIYETNRGDNGVNENISQLTKRSIFEGASRDEILEYLADAKERVEVLIDETSSSSLAHHHHNLHHLHHGLPTRPNLVSTRRNRTSNVSNVSSSSNDSSTTATSSSIETEDCSLTNSTTGTPVERNDSGVGVETSKPLKIRRTNNLTGESEQTCADCEQLIEPKEINGIRSNNRHHHLDNENDDQIMYYNIVCSKCEKKRSERKEIISEFVDTEFKYGRDLRIIREEFHRPMEVAGLLTKDQIKGVFINLEELINVNSKFSEKLQDAIDIASEQGDEDFTTVNIGKLFMESASMLHSFETYCLHQGSASVLLNQLEKEKELLRIFLRVSQMENTLLRRMNLSAFLMVPVQRVTKYPLLLNRLYKVTPHHHQDRDALKMAQQKVEIHLEHINQQTKGSTAPTKIWRKFSHLSNRRLPSIDDIGDIKLRKVALEAMSWTRDQANFIMSGRLSFLPSSEYQLYKKRGNIKFSSASCLLMSLGEMLPTIKANLTEDDEEEFERELMFPRSNHGCEQAVIILIKEKHNRYTLCREPFNLASCVVSSDNEFEDIFEIHEQNTKESFIFKADSPTEKRDWYRQICYHSKNLGNWRKRRNALANIMMVRP